MNDPTKLDADIDTKRQTHSGSGAGRQAKYKADLGGDDVPRQWPAEGCSKVSITGGDSTGAATAIAFAGEADVADPYLFEDEENSCHRSLS